MEDKVYHSKMIAKIIKDYAPKALEFVRVHPHEEIVNYFYLLAISPVLAYATAPVTDEFRHAFKELTQKKWEEFKITKNGRDLLDLYDRAQTIKDLLKESSQLPQFLKKLNNKKIFSSLVEGFIKTGNLEVIRQMVEHPVLPKQKIQIDCDLCVLAVKANQPEILDYLISQSKPLQNHSYLYIFAIKAIENSSQEVLLSTLSNGLDVNIHDGILLLQASSLPGVSLSHLLIEHGASPFLKSVRKQKPDVLADLESFYNKKILNDSLNKSLEHKTVKSQMKI